mmetsp:Transcript_26105/g.62021  ORF Transcript_26105/g.62021 Transcript_26105/m.62021 type:complete len:225 (-) Transcript_26105:306-980(-)
MAQRVSAVIVPPATRAVSIVSDTSLSAGRCATCPNRRSAASPASASADRRRSRRADRRDSSRATSSPMDRRTARRCPSDRARAVRAADARSSRRRRHRVWASRTSPSSSAGGALPPPSPPGTAASSPPGGRGRALLPLLRISARVDAAQVSRWSRDDVTWAASRRSRSMAASTCRSWLSRPDAAGDRPDGVRRSSAIISSLVVLVWLFLMGLPAMDVLLGVACS